MQASPQAFHIAPSSLRISPHPPNCLIGLTVTPRIPGGHPSSETIESEVAVGCLIDSRRIVRGGVDVVVVGPSRGPEVPMASSVSNGLAEACRKNALLGCGWLRTGRFSDAT